MDRQHHCGAVQYGTIKLSTLALALSSTNPDPTLSIQLDTDSDLLNSLLDFKTIVGSTLSRDYRWKFSKSFPTKIIISLDSRKNISRREARGELIFSKWPCVVIHRQSSIRLARELIASYCFSVDLCVSNGDPAFSILANFTRNIAPTIFPAY